MKKSEVQMVVVVGGKKRENRERRGDQYFVCVRACVPYQLTIWWWERECEKGKGKGRKKSSWRRNDDGRRSRWQPRRRGHVIACLETETDTARGVWCVRCAVCHIQCATFAQDYLLSLLSPNNFSLLTNSLLTNSLLTTHSQVSQPRHSHRFIGNFSYLPACLPAYLV